MSSPNNLDNPLAYICAYPLSGQYGPSRRILFYTLTTLYLLTPVSHSPYTSAGSLSAVLTYAAISSIHLSALSTFRPRPATLASAPPQAIDFDAPIAFSIVLTAALLYPLAAKQASRLGNRAKGVVLALVALMLWSGVVSWSVMVRDLPKGDVCRTSNGEGLLANREGRRRVGECESSCSDVKMRMRSHSTAINAVPIGFLEERRVSYGLVVGVTGYLVIGFVVAMMTPARGQVEAQVLISSTSPVQRPQARNRGRWRWLGSRSFIMAATVILLLVWVPIAEWNLWGLPTEEGPDAVGQWGPIVAVGLVAGAAWVKGFVDKRVQRGKVNNGVEEGGWLGPQVHSDFVAMPAKMEPARMEVARPFS